MVSNVCIVAKSPMGNEYFTLALRTALATQAEGFDTQLVFMDEAVLGLTGKMPGYLERTLETFKENEGQVYCAEQDLKKLNLSEDQLNTQIDEVLDSDDLAEMFEDNDSVNVY